MSLKAMDWVWELELPMAAKFVLLVLANLADLDNVCHPSQAVLAKATGQTERSVRRQLKNLEERGLIDREQRALPAGGRATDKITLLLQHS